MTYEAFAAVMEPLEGLPYRPESPQSHWEGLRDLDEAALTRAVTAALRTCKSYPPPATLRELAEQTAPIVTVSPAEAGHCDQCRDTGWRETAARTVERCVCWATNPVLVRRRQKDAQWAARRTSAREART